MRRVGLGNRLAGLGIVAIWLGMAPAAVAEPQEASPPEEVAVAAPQQDDYYTRRAKGILEAEKSQAATPHPLAASYPGLDIVVCEAGCATRGAPNVVFARRQAAPAQIGREGRMVTTSDAGGAPAPGTVASDTGVTCIAGCYDDTEADTPSAGAVGDWATHTDAVTPARDKLSPIR